MRLTKKVVDPLLVLALLLKTIGIVQVYSFPLPTNFPPETSLSRVGYWIYVLTGRTFNFLNQKIRIFPSFLIPLIEKDSAKTLFLKLPFLLIDLLILFIFIYLFFKFPKKKKWPRISSVLLLANLWPFYFSDSLRLSLKDQILKLIFKPYKVSLAERRVLLLSIATIFVVVGRHLTFRIRFKLKKISRIIIKKLTIFRLAVGLFLLVSLAILNYFGVFLNFNSKDEVSWKGFWVRASGNPETENLYVIFEKDFSLIFKPKKAVIYSFCQDEYRLFVNEDFVGQGGLVADNSMAYFETWPVTDLLKKGRNHIRIECYNHYLDTNSLVKKEMGLIFQLEAERGIFKKRVVSDSSWKAIVDNRYEQKTSFVSKTTGFQQFFDGTRSISKWQKAEIIDRPPIPPWRDLKPRPIPLLETKEVSPEKILSFGRFQRNEEAAPSDLAEQINNGLKLEDKKAGFKNLESFVKKDPAKFLEISGISPFLVLDFGRIIVGYPEISFKSSEKGILNIGFAETLKKDGSPDVAKMVSQADQLKVGEGDFSYRWFQRRAFRYVILIFEGFERPVFLNKFFAQAINYPANDQESYFLSSDPLLNKIFEVSKYTAKIASQGNFEDCPHRERAQYLGDTRIVSLVNYYNFSDKRLIKKALKEFALSQEEDGFVRGVYPAGKKLLIPDYSAQWVTAVWEYYLYSGDIDFLREIYPFLKKQISGFIKYSDEDGLVREQSDWWVFIDHGNQVQNTDKSISLNLFYLEAVNSFSKISNEIKAVEDFQEARKLSQKIKRSVNQKSWRENSGLYDDCLRINEPCYHFSRQTNYLALKEQIIPPGRLRPLITSLFQNHQLPQILTPYFNTFVADSLFLNGFEKKGLDLIREYWGEMLRRGATTFWETYDLKLGKENPAYGESLSHGWSSGPAYLLPKWVLGVKPIDPGFKVFEVKPAFAGLNFASGKIPISGNRTIEVSWSKSRDFELNLYFDFPARAEVVLPDFENKTLYLDDKILPGVIKKAGFLRAIIERPGRHRFLFK